MKQKNNAGFSLIECLVAITVLALIVVPVGSSFILAFKMNAKTDNMLQSQLAVSSAVETLMAEGIGTESVENVETKYGVKVDITGVPAEDPKYYQVTVKSSDESVSVDTNIRTAQETEPEGGSTP